MTAAASNNQFSILLVDDRDENLISLQAILDQPNRTFILARSGNEALKIAMKHDDIGLILLDVQMPDMDGFEVARLLKSSNKTKDISIIFVTAISTDQHHILKGFEEGAVDYLQKPLDVNVTKAKVNVFERLYFYQRDLKVEKSKVQDINKQLEKFVYTVAHDIKSPLTGIKGLLSIISMAHELDANPKLKEFLDLAIKASNHLAGMISSILEYSKTSIDQQRVEEVNTRELVQHISEILFPPGNIKIVVMENMPLLKTRKLKIEQVFQNLIGNAIKYSDKDEGYIEIGCTDMTDHHRFYIKDNGQGISEENNKIVFQLFSKTDNTTDRETSTGVGLNIVKLMIEEQGGKIWVDSEPGAGSTFYFEWKKH